MHRLFFTCICILAGCAFSATAFSAETLRQEIFDPSFRSLKVTNPDNFFAPPVIRLNSNDHIVITFDELGDDYSDLQYRIIHCNADWTQSRLIESQFLESFNIASIDDYAFSSNTYIHFVNYRIEIPNQSMQPLASGNYILQVFPQSDPDYTILQAAFMVSENVAFIAGSASGRTDRATNENLQQVEFSVNTGDFNIRDPFTEIFAIVTQNNDPASAHTITRPLRISGKNIVYEHSPQLIFPAGNEFRRFETVRADYPGMHVDSVRYQGENYHAFLSTDYPRVYSQYSFDSTQKGRFIIRESNATDSDLGADYITVHFSLKSPLISGSDLFIQGEFSNWICDKRFQLKYDSEKQQYSAQIPLKQGSYNYRYVAIPTSGFSPNIFNPIEGDKYETLNEYTVAIYYKTPGAITDRLLGVANFIAQP